VPGLLLSHRMPRRISTQPAQAAAFSAIGLMIALLAAHAVFDLGGRPSDGFFKDGLYTAIEFAAVAIAIARVIRRPENRLAWGLIAAGLLVWAAGDLVWAVWLNDLADPPYPSIADALYLLMYPAIYAALLMLMRAHFRHAGAAVWLDGLVVGLTTAAIGAALVFPDVLATSTGGTAAVTVSLAYPLGDFLLLVFVALGFTLSGWRPGRQWLLMGLGLAVSAGADMIFVYQEANGTYVPGRILDTAWPASMALIALAAWQPEPQRAGLRPASHAILLPAGCGLLAFGLLLSAGLHPLTHLALGLAAGAVFVAGLRGALTYIENGRMLRRQTHDAVTDMLTGLSNRRRLIEDLGQAVRRAEQGQQATLAFFDLNGFKNYNDTFGHRAGDEMLANLGHALERSVLGHGAAYRLGGDEFCILLEGRFPSGDAVIARARAALAEQGSGFTINASCGVVSIPGDAAGVTAVLSLADERMYAEKGTGGRGPLAQTQNVLLQLLTEREPSLRSHVRDVGDLAVAVGRKLHLDSEQLDELRRAAELHDIGKLAIPEEILQKPGPLSEDEWRFLHQHTVIGARILNVAPALRTVSDLVRSSHERWDGTGYPDQRAGLAIPLGARIIAACDAYDAMISDRPYQAARSPEEALAELRRHAGTQFDPEIVPVLCEVTETIRLEPFVADPRPQLADPHR
jgi:two-component system, cell cycle response regulator